jgi:hypothetical protein
MLTKNALAYLPTLIGFIISKPFLPNFVYFGNTKMDYDTKAEQ